MFLLEEKAEIIRDIQAKFALRGREMTANNLKQALIPHGASILPNDSGTAPGIIWQPLQQIKDFPFDFKDNIAQNLTILTFPGQNLREMKQMWQDTAIPF